MSNVLTFKSHQIRTHVESGAIWFVAKDVCMALGLTWSSRTLDAIPTEWKGGIKLITPFGKRGGGTQTLRSISEPAVYKLAFRSNKPEADAFTNWVASEVLPSIRKTGKFEIAPKQAALPSPAHLAELDKLWRDFDQFRYQTYLRGQEFFERLREITSPLYKRVVYRGKPNPGLHTDYMIEGLHSPAWRFTEGLKDASGDFYFAILQAKAYAEAMTVMKD